MLRERFAEWILSLVTTPERASSIVGDLLEDVSARGGFWFWRCILRTVLAVMMRNFAAAPLGMLAFACIGWFIYMIVGLVLLFFAQILTTLSWGLAYFFMHHTGFELLTNLLKLRMDWPPPPFGTPHRVELIVLCIAAPFQVGRLMARCWPGREVTAWLIVLLIWPVLSISVPFAAASIRIGLSWMPLIQASVLFGAMWGRHVCALPSNRRNLL